MDDNRRRSADRQSPITGAAANDYKLQRNGMITVNKIMAWTNNMKGT